MFGEQLENLGWQTISTVFDWLTHPLFTLGESAISVTTILKLVVFVIVVFWVSRIVRRTLETRVLPKTGIESGIAHSLANVAFYVLVSLGMIIGLQTTGIELSTLTVLFGAVGVGVGFGLQNIASNFISGLIILLERPIKIGDRIQIGDLNGRVISIKARATEIVTNDAISVIIPNSDFISQQVINWSHGVDRVRFRIPVGVAYGSDIETVRKALMEAAGNVDAVLKSPQPKVWLVGFGDSSVDFQLLAWTRDLLHRRGEFTSQVNYAIHDALAKHNIEIPFPQRDLHLRSPGILEVASRASAEN